MPLTLFSAEGHNLMYRCLIYACLEKKISSRLFYLANSGAAAVMLLYFPTCMKLMCLLRMCINESFYTEHFIALKKGKCSYITLQVKYFL